MCGIAGILSIESRPGALRAVERMLDAMAHRGPDGEGIFEFSGGVLGHRRLAILDLSESGHQPMHLGDATIVFNGEIYNYRELRCELKSLGHVFQGQSDTEVLLHAYACWGEACLQRLRGMWAFAVLDASRRRLVLSRDRFGIKPLYWVHDRQRGSLTFASEIKAILATGLPARACERTLAEYLVVGVSDHRRETFFEGVHQLLPGEQAAFDLQSGSFEIERYYSLRDAAPQHATVEGFHTALLDSVRLHLRSDVTVGTCLSGGLDSSLIASLASAARDGEQSPFAAFTARSTAPEQDETAHARKVVERCGLQWNVVSPSYEDFARDIVDCLSGLEEPTLGPSVYMQYAVMRRAREADVKVLLDGQGGDEAMLGYLRYYPAFLRDLLRRGRAVTLGRELIAARRRGTLRWRDLVLLGVYFLVAPARRRLLTRRARFLKPEWIRRGLECLDELHPRRGNLRDLQAAEIEATCLPHLLRYEDRNSMAHSIEARVPFVDAACLETALALPAEAKIRQGFTKYALRLLAERTLPESIAWRTDKLGFEAPASEWLERHRDAIEERVTSSHILRAICRFSPRLERLTRDMQWRLFNLACWEEAHSVRLLESPPAEPPPAAR